MKDDIVYQKIRSRIRKEKAWKCLFFVVLIALAVFLIATGKVFGQENLLENPGFETGDFTDWTIEDHDSSTYYVDSTCSYEGQYSAFLKSNQVGEFWHFWGGQVVLTDSSQGYQLSCYLKSQSETNVIINLCQNDSPWVYCGLWDTVWTNTNWTLYETQFTATKTDTARISFNMGHHDIGIWIDDVTLIETIHVDTMPPNPQIQNFYVYPNPCFNYIHLAFPDNFQGHEPQIYNIRGQKINIEMNDLLFNLTNEPAGIYFVRVENETRKIVKLE